MELKGGSQEGGVADLMELKGGSQEGGVADLVVLKGGSQEGGVSDPMFLVHHESTYLFYLLRLKTNKKINKNYYLYIKHNTINTYLHKITKGRLKPSPQKIV